MLACAGSAGTATRQTLLAHGHTLRRAKTAGADARARAAPRRRLAGAPFHLVRSDPITTKI